MGDLGLALQAGLLEVADGRRVTAGDNIASPAATTLTACTNSRGGVSFSRNPLAPACSASTT